MKPATVGAAGAVVVAALAALAAASSPFVAGVVARRLAPIVGGASAVWVLAAVAMAIALVALGRARRSGAPLLAAAVVGTVVAGFNWGHLDWLRAFTQRVTTDQQVPPPVAVLPALLAMAAALAFGQLALWSRAEARYLAKGVGPEEARHARAQGATGAVAVVGLAGLSLAVAVVFHLWSLGGPLPPAAYVAAAVYPVVGLAVVGALLALALRSRARTAGP